MVQVAERDRVAGRMREKGIATGQYFLPIHRQPAYSPQTTQRRQGGDSPEFVIDPGGLPVTERVGARTLALPFFNRITETGLRAACQAAAAAIGG